MEKPKVWKMLLISWLFVYPVINIMFALVFPLIKELPQLVHSYISTTYGCRYTTSTQEVLEMDL